MSKSVIKTAVLILFFLSLVSCINIDTEITFRQDLSGEAIIRYSIAKSVFNTGKIDSEQSFLPLPVEEERYREKARKTAGLELLSYKREDSENEVLITVRYGFSNTDALNVIVTGGDDKKIDIQRRGDRTYYTQNVYSGTAAEGETLKVAEALFADRYVRIKITAPASVKSASSGTYSGTSAEVNYSLISLISSASPSVWEISW